MSSKVSISHGNFATKQRLAANSHFGDKDEQIESKDLEPSNYAIQLFAKSRCQSFPAYLNYAIQIHTKVDAKHSQPIYSRKHC